jgi:hypothetical protein
LLVPLRPRSPCVGEDFRHIVNMVEEAISRNVANLLLAKDNYQPRQFAHVCCAYLHRAMLKSVQPPQMLSMLP